MAVNDQMEMAFSEPVGQDPVSGNDIPIGSLPEEVRDDVPAMLSEGEYVVPADVLRFYGLKFFEDLRSEAKMSLAQMEAGGRIGGEPLEAGSPAVSSSELPSEGSDSQMLQASVGGAVGFKDGGVQRAMDAGYPKSPIENANTGLDKYMETVTTPPNPKPMYRGGMAGYAAGGSVEDLLSDMENYADGGAVLSGYDAGGAIPYLNLQSYYPTQNNFDPMNYGLGFSSNLIKPAAPFKTAASIKQQSGVDEPEGETEAERIARRMAEGGPDNNPHNDPANMGLSGMTIGQIEKNLEDLQPNKDDNFIVSKLKAWQLSNTERYKTTQAYRDKLAKEVIAGNQASKDIMTSDNYSAPDTTGGGYGSQQAAENAAAAGIDSGTGSTGISQGSGTTYGGGPMNKGGFISRRKKT